MDNFQTRWSDGLFHCGRSFGRATIDFPEIIVWVSVPLVAIPAGASPIKRRLKLNASRSAIQVGGVWRSLYLPVGAKGWLRVSSEPWATRLAAHKMTIMLADQPPRL